MKRIACVLACAGILAPLLAAQQSDVILQAMRDELERSRQLRVASTDPLYFIEYGVEDADYLTIHASLGALVNMSRNSAKIPTVRVRLGSFAFDNANHVFSDFFTGSRYDPEHLPMDPNYAAIRRVLWLATDREFKTAQEAIGRKRSALRNINVTDSLPDFSAVQPVQSVQPVHRTAIDEDAWKARTVKLSGILCAYPRILSSSVEFEVIQSTTYLATSEGTVIRMPENLAYLRLRAYAQAPDGMYLREGEVFQSQELSQFPTELDLKRGITAVADELTALASAPVGEGYDGPVLFEPRAAAQLFAQMLGDNLKITRKPIPEPGRSVPYLPSELENKIGSRILPEWMDVVDDPTQKEWRGQPLFGHYEYDTEGVQPQPLNLVEKGVLKTFLLTRTPVRKGLESSNGHARLRGNFGQAGPGFGNLFIRASQTVSSAALKQKLIEMCAQRGKPYGLLVRKLDFPSSLAPDELRRAIMGMSQSGGGSRPVALPLLVYRVYPDGREELVRGLRFRGLSTRSLKDIAAAGDDSVVFSFLDSNVAFALMGAGSEITNAAVISPGILFEELELEREPEEFPKLPIVPPPPLGS